MKDLLTEWKRFLSEADAQEQGATASTGIKALTTNLQLGSKMISFLNNQFGATNDLRIFCFLEIGRAHV